MNEEQLKESAETYWQKSEHGHLSKANCIESFKAGARWHESLPLADRLSESEKEKIRKIYNDFKNFKTQGVSLVDRTAANCQCLVLEGIFGKTLFTPTEQ